MRTRPAAVAAFAIGIAALPFFAPPFVAYQLTFAGAYAIAILGLVILIGQSGQISLGHGAFLAVGGYTVAVLLHAAGISYILSTPLAALACAILGVALGAVALRLASIYLALATFALAASISPLLKRFGSITGGVQGLLLPSLPRLHIFGSEIRAEVWFYYVTWAVAALLFTVAYIALRGRIGRSLRAIRDSQVAAVSFGVNPVFYKTLAFGWSAAYAGIAGSLLAATTAYVSPDVYSVSLSFTLLVGVVIGGLDMMWGAILGGMVVEFLPFWVQKVNPALSAVVYGIALVLIMTLMPGGIAGGIERLLHVFRFQGRESRQTVPIVKDLSS